MSGEPPPSGAGGQDALLALIARLAAGEPAQRIEAFERRRGPRLTPESATQVLEGSRGPLFPLPASRERVGLPETLSDVAPVYEQLFVDEILRPRPPEIPRGVETWSPAEMERLLQDLEWRERRRRSPVAPRGRAG
ncbi:MAG: hypothetical protein ACREM3_28605 [Candidatus Rokuibacteriota bacterium]